LRKEKTLKARNTDDAIVGGEGMSADRTSDDADDANLPAVERDAVSTGAAADSADSDERLNGLPRLLRFAMLISGNARHINERLIAEINELCPNLPLHAAWATAPDVDTGLALAAELDRRAVTQNEPNLRSLADCARLLCLPLPREATYFEEHRRVGKALVQAFHGASRHAEEQLRCDLERFTFGWAALPACTDLLSKNLSAAVNATMLGASMAEHRIAAVKAAARRRAEEEKRRKEEEDEKATEASQQVSSPAVETIPDHHLVVARLSSDEMKNTKLKDILGPLKSVINAALPLVEVPPLHQVRSTLIFEFPLCAGRSRRPYHRPAAAATPRRRSRWRQVQICPPPWRGPWPERLARGRVPRRWRGIRRNRPALVLG
jgi:hypothetical protein